MPEYTFSTPGSIALVVKNLGGNVVIRATDGDTTNVCLSGAQADEATVTQSGDTITVQAPHPDWQEAGLLRNWGRDHRLDITIDAPTGSHVRVKLGAGEVQLTGMLGSVEVRSGAGDVHIADATSESSVHIGAGNIHVDSIAATTRLSSGAGKIHLGEANGEARLNLGMGDVSIGHVAAPVFVKSGAGEVLVSAVTGDLTVNTGFGGTMIERISAGRFTYKGTGGDITVGVPTGTPTWTELSTVAGRVSNDLPSVGEPKPGQDHVELRVTTVSGAIELHPV